MKLVLTIIFIFALIFILYNLSQKKNEEAFSIVHPYYNPYYPYANPYSQCVEDIYGNTRCYAPSYYNKYYLPYRRQYPHRFKKVFRRYV